MDFGSDPHPKFNEMPAMLHARHASKMLQKSPPAALKLLFKLSIESERFMHVPMFETVF
jgi:hypothetical protein